MSRMRYLGQMDFEGEVKKVYLINRTDLVYLAPEEEEDFLIEKQAKKEDFQEVQLESRGLEEAIRQALGKPMDSLSKSDLASIEILNISDIKIDDFEGLKDLVNLRILRASGQASIGPYLKQIRELKKLEVLDLSHCQIASLDQETFFGMTKLSHLNLAGNPLSQVSSRPFSSNINLKSLDLTGTGIKDLELLEGLRHLEKLIARNNYIMSLLGLRFAQNIRHLDIASNIVNSLRLLRTMRNLSVLDVSNNGLEDLDHMRGLVHLEHLIATGNYIEDLEPLKRLANLELLDLNNNRISDIAPLRELKNLRKLSLKDNKIRSVKALANLDNLRELMIEGNLILDYSSLDGIYDSLSSKDF